MKNYRIPRKYLRPRKQPKKCQYCGKRTDDLYTYVDESNIAITRNAPYLCKDCYQHKYGNK